MVRWAFYQWVAIHMIARRARGIRGDDDSFIFFARSKFFEALSVRKKSANVNERREKAGKLTL